MQRAVFAAAHNEDETEDESLFDYARSKVLSRRECWTDVWIHSSGVAADTAKKANEKVKHQATMPGGAKMKLPEIRFGYSWAAEN